MPGQPAATEADGSKTGAVGDFAGLLNAEVSMVEMLDELKLLLSAEDVAQLENMLAEGQILPVAEIVAALKQQLSDVGAEQLLSPTLKLSDLMPADMAVVTEEVDAAAAANIAEQAETLMPAEQVVVPIVIVSPVTAPAPIAADQMAIMQTANGKPQPAVTGQAAVPTAIEGNAAGLSSGLNNSSADSDQQPPAGQFRMMEAMMAQAAQKTPANSLFRVTESGLAAINSSPVAAAGVALQNIAQPIVPSQLHTALPIYTPMGEKGWDQAVGERILWMVGRQIQGAEVRVTPPHLGPIDIRISIQNDQANVTFSAQHGVVRDALEVSIPRLREMLGENNLQLSNVDVNQRNASGEQASSRFFNPSSPGGQGREGHEGEEDESIMGSVRIIQSDGLVDDFA